MLGDSCVDLGQGFPNFDPPLFVVEALRDELDGTVPGAVRTRHQYTRTAGHVTLVEALAERYSGHLQRPLDAMKEVAVTVGATNALFLAMQAALSLSNGREIVVLEPFFELYRSQATEELLHSFSRFFARRAASGRSSAAWRCASTKRAIPSTWTRRPWLPRSPTTPVRSS